MIYVGDEEKDISGAKAIYIKTVLVDRYNKKFAIGEDYRVKSLKELRNIC